MLAELSNKAKYEIEKRPITNGNVKIGIQNEFESKFVQYLWFSLIHCRNSFSFYELLFIIYIFIEL